MPVVNVRNIWGTAVNPIAGAPASLRSHDIQRNDLWQLDLSGVVARLKAQLLEVVQPISFGRVTEIVQSLPVPNETTYYAQSLDLPELKMDTPTIMRDTLPYLTPGQDQVPGNVRVVFLVDAGAPTPTQGAQLLNLLFVWRAAVRAGRGSFEGGFEDQDDYELAWGLADANPGSLQSDFRFDVPVSLLRGGSTVGRNAMGRPNMMEVASSLKIKQMWLFSIQPSTLQYSSSAAVWTVTATFGCSGWLPLPLDY